VAEFKNIVESGREIFVLDVRTETEFEQARLDFTDLRIRHDSVAVQLALLPEDKSTLIYCFCRVGGRSGYATNVLMENGYTNVHNVSGGLVAWQGKGFDVVGD